MNTTALQQIKLGTQVHCILHGGRDGTVVAIHGEARPESIINFPGLTTGGNAEYDIIWDNSARSQRIPECIIRGVQWRILDLPRATDERILELGELADQKVERDRIEAEAKRAAKAERRATLIEENPKLEIGEGSKVAAKNIRTQLKQSFDWVKFSVRSDHSSVNVSWTDGPTVEQVEEITRNYSEGHFDGNDDSYHYNADRAWPFGGTRYIFESRNISDEIRAEAVALIAEHFHPSCDLDQERYRIMRRTTIPAGHKLTGITDEGFPAFTTAPR